MTRTALIYGLAAIAEIGGCFGFWMWLRQGQSVVWLPIAVLSLIAFAWLLTLVPADAAGRAYAAYGGVYIAAALAWMWLVEGARPDRWDLIGACICVLGAAVILFGPRSTVS